MKNNFYVHDCKTAKSPDFGDFRLIRCIFPGGGDRVSWTEAVPHRDARHRAEDGAPQMIDMKSSLQS